MQINTGKGSVPLAVAAAIWSVSAVVSLPGLAVSPIMGDLNTIFPHVSNLEIQMLTSIPSAMIIPFILLSGRLSVARNKNTLLRTGLAIFLLSGVACVFARTMTQLIVISCLLGAGAGIVIPLSTGLVVDYFTGDCRVRQLGISSAVNNLTLVIATAVTGYLAGVDWHLPFLVYTLPAITLVLTAALRRVPPAPEPPQSDQLRQTRINRGRLAALMGIYFFITYTVLVVTFYTSFLAEGYKFKESFPGVAISLFFLAIMAPGLYVNRLIRHLGRNLNVVSLAMMSAGLLLVGCIRSEAAIIAGAMVAGLGYGIMQPVIYDKTAIISPPQTATLSLSFVMAVNYLAVLACPFMVDLFGRIFGMSHDNRFPFVLNAILAAFFAVWAYAKRDDFSMGMDSSYVSDDKDQAR